MNTPDQIERAAGFARGFFLSLENRGIRAAVLHAGDNGFEHVLSDIDFVIDPSAFEKLANLINEYCAQVGWQLCQILRHETTAAFCVCSAIDDPACAVALDACSDYQRNGTFYLATSDLLANRQQLSWGGLGVSHATELRYRFAKAAAKNKDPDACVAEFARYPETARRDCTAWLALRWGLIITSWDAAGLAPNLAKLREKSNQYPSLIHRGTLRRVVSRILLPTGLIVIAGREDFELTATRLESIFGHLYFRRFRKVRQWRISFLKDLIASTMIVVPELSFPWPSLVPASCIHRLNLDERPEVQISALAKHLHERCKNRESL